MADLREACARRFTPEEMELLDQAIAPNVKAVNDWLVKTKADSPIVGKYLWDYIDKIGYTIYDIVKFICGKIKLA